MVSACVFHLCDRGVGDMVNACVFHLCDRGVGDTVVSVCVFHLCQLGSIFAICQTSHDLRSDYGMIITRLPRESKLSSMINYVYFFIIAQFPRKEAWPPSLKRQEGVDVDEVEPNSMAGESVFSLGLEISGFNLFPAAKQAR